MPLQGTSEDTAVVPCELVWRSGQPIVAFAEVERKFLAMPFWHQTLKRRRRIVGLKPLDAITAGTSDLKLVGMIHHMTRCGSTLVARQLSSLPDVFALSEPEIFAQLLDPAHGTTEARARWLRLLIAAHRDALRPRASRLAIKWSSVLALRAREIEAALPEVPAIFLYREAVEVLVSILNEPLGGARARRAEHLPADLRPADFEAAGARHLELEARYIAAVCRGIGETVRTRRVNYRTLPAATWEKIAPLFGLAPDAAALREMVHISQFHAKDSSASQIFRHDSWRKRQQADAEIAQLAQTFIAPDLAAMERRLSSL